MTINRIDVINMLIESRGYKRYLEIGCQADIAFKAIKAPHKVGVDPVSGGTIRTSSDLYFATTTELFDLIFIDGDHHHAQVLRDIKNALFHLAPRGTIAMHDCLPPDAAHESLSLCGTAWRAFLQTRERPHLESFTCDFDYGVGIIRVHPNSAVVHSGRNVETLTYSDFLANRRTWMRPVNAGTFAKLIVTPETHWPELLNR